MNTDQMNKFAAMDIGTNSVKMVIAGRDVAGRWETLRDEVEITRLGQGLQKTGLLNPEAMNRTLAVIGKMTQDARAAGAEQIAAVGTMALRTAGNATLFLKRVMEKCGIQVEIISGKEEACLSYGAVADDSLFSGPNMVVFDIGGGSTEFIYRLNHEELRQFSLTIGAVRFTEEILLSDPVTEGECEEVMGELKKQLMSLELPESASTLVGIGGTLTTLVAVNLELVNYDPAAVHGACLSQEEVNRLRCVFQRSTINERKMLPGMPAKRADVILAGVLIVQAVMRKTGVEQVSVSNKGLRHGLLMDRFGA